MANIEKFIARPLSGDPPLLNNFSPFGFIEGLRKIGRDYLKRENRNQFVIGVNGDVDSAVTLVALHKAGLPVIGVYIGTKAPNESEEKQLRQIEKLTNKKIQRRIVKTDLIRNDQKEDDTDRLKGRTSFIDQIRLYGLNTISRRIPGSVRLSTINGTELRTGSFVKEEIGFGDFFPLLTLSETQIRELGEALGMPISLLKKLNTNKQVVHLSVVSEAIKYPTNYEKIWKSAKINRDRSNPKHDTIMLPPQIYAVLDEIYSALATGKSPSQLVAAGSSQREVMLAVELRNHYEYKITPLIEVARKNTPYKTLELTHDLSNSYKFSPDEIHWSKEKEKKKYKSGQSRVLLPRTTPLFERRKGNWQGLSTAPPTSRFLLPAEKMRRRLINLAKKSTRDLKGLNERYKEELVDIRKILLGVTNLPEDGSTQILMCSSGVEALGIAAGLLSRSDKGSVLSTRRAGRLVNMAFTGVDPYNGTGSIMFQQSVRLFSNGVQPKEVLDDRKLKQRKVYYYPTDDGKILSLQDQYSGDTDGAQIQYSDQKILREFRKVLRIRDYSICHVATVDSFGRVLPWREMLQILRQANISRERNNQPRIKVILNMVQPMGRGLAEDVDLSSADFDAVVFVGHKGLGGPMSNGLIMFRESSIDSESSWTNVAPYVRSAITRQYVTTSRILAQNIKDNLGLSPYTISLPELTGTKVALDDFFSRGRGNTFYERRIYNYHIVGGLTKKIEDRLNKIEGLSTLRNINPDAKFMAGIIGFKIDGIDANQMTIIKDLLQTRYGIVLSGNIGEIARISIPEQYLYNGGSVEANDIQLQKDVEYLGNSLEELLTEIRQTEKLDSVVVGHRAKAYSSGEKPDAHLKKIDVLEDSLARLNPGSMVLSIGPGTGKVEEVLLSRGYQVHAIDVNDDVLAQALKAAPGLITKNANALDLPYPDLSIPLIWAGTVGHEIYSIYGEDGVVKWYKEMARVLAANGEIVIRDSYCPDNPKQLVGVKLLTEDAKEFVRLYSEFSLLPTNTTFDIKDDVLVTDLKTAADFAFHLAYMPMIKKRGSEGIQIFAREEIPQVYAYGTLENHRNWAEQSGLVLENIKLQRSQITEETINKNISIYDIHSKTPIFLPPSRMSFVIKHKTD